jgi:hypothetical protein
MEAHHGTDCLNPSLITRKKTWSTRRPSRAIWWMLVAFRRVRKNLQKIEIGCQGCCIMLPPSHRSNKSNKSRCDRLGILMPRNRLQIKMQFCITCIECIALARRLPMNASMPAVAVIDGQHLPCLNRPCGVLRSAGNSAKWWRPILYQQPRCEDKL